MAIKSRQSRGRTTSDKYHVALSFAGEDRPYVDAVAKKLEKDGVSVFYDRFEDTKLWGKDLYSYLTDVYQKRALYTVVFISAAYAKKTWTNVERRAAQARAFSENSEYILPALLEKKVEIQGILPTTGYIDLQSLTPEQCAEKIIKKLRDERVFLLPEEKFSYSEEAKADVDFSVGAGRLKEVIKDLKSHDWYVQNPAIGKVSDLDWHKMTPDQIFVLGRNLYQCACGGARSAQAMVNSLRRFLAELPLDASTHLLNGMLYEVYFDSKGEFRGDRLKSGYMRQLFAIQKVQKYEDSINFIRRALMPYRQSLAILPNTIAEMLEIKLTISKKDPPVVKSIECMGRELLISTADNEIEFARPNLWKLSRKAFTVGTFRTEVADAWHIPEDQLEIEIDPPNLKNAQLRLPEDSTIVQPFE